MSKLVFGTTGTQVGEAKHWDDEEAQENYEEAHVAKGRVSIEFEFDMLTLTTSAEGLSTLAFTSGEDMIPLVVFDEDAIQMYDNCVKEAK